MPMGTGIPVPAISIKQRPMLQLQVRPIVALLFLLAARAEATSELRREVLFEQRHGAVQVAPRIAAHAIELRRSTAAPATYRVD